MKLHKVEFLHYGPKDSEEGIRTWVVFDRDETDLRDQIDKRFSCYWADKGKDYESEDENALKSFIIYDEKYNEIGTETYPERLLRLRGDLHDDDDEGGDAYYGITLHGWDEGQEISDADAETLLRLGVAEDWREGATS